MKRLIALVVVALTLVAVSACGSDSHGSHASSGTPDDSSAEAGFARDMSVHHAQAVAMAEAIRDRTTDPELKLLATDIALGQQGQIGRMSGWLDEWGLNQTATATPMAWIRSDNLLSAGTDSSSGMGGMSGMGTDS